MVQINKVGHVVLGVRDPQASLEFYHNALGMEIVGFMDRIQMGFLSFGPQHHDLAVVKVPDDATVGSQGLTHVALQINGGLEELRTLYERVQQAGGRVERPHDFGFMKGFYFYDPDGNRVELFYEELNQEESKEFLRNNPGSYKPFSL
jgi:catechol 2,3-dioxygenase